MSDITREEVTARIEASEARLETRLVAMDGKLDRLIDRVDAAARDSRDAKTAASGIKWNILATALATIGVLIAAWAIWAQGIEMVSGFFGAISNAPTPPPPGGT